MFRPPTIENISHPFLSITRDLHPENPLPEPLIFRDSPTVEELYRVLLLFLVLMNQSDLKSGPYTCSDSPLFRNEARTEPGLGSDKPLFYRKLLEAFHKQGVRRVYYRW